MNHIVAPSSYFTGISGETIVQHILAKWRIASSKLTESDFGEDFICDIFAVSDDEKVNIRTNLTFRLQVKTTAEISTDGYIRKTNKGFSFSLSTTLLNQWFSNYYPTILVIWDLKEECGYWCAPLKEYPEIPEQEKITIHFNKNNNFIKSEKQIKEYIQEYYNKLLKIANAQYSCTIYPIWMPKYRIFTSMELYDFFKINFPNEKIKVELHCVDHLPSFITSYNNLELSGLPCIVYTDKSHSITEYILELKQYLFNNSFSLIDGSWISFIISPIEIISQKEYRVISQMTDWSCFSLVEGQLVSDIDYTFNIGDDYIYTKEVRATSDSQNLFININGNYAVEVFATGYALTSRRSYNEIHNKLFRQSFCIWDISNCSEDEKEQLSGWCSINDCKLQLIESYTNIVMISHFSFSPSPSLIMLPGVVTWQGLDNLNMNSQEFTSKIPFGCPADEKTTKEIINLFSSNMGRELNEEIYLQYQQVLSGEPLNHSERLVHFIMYLIPADLKKFEKAFKEVKIMCSKLFINNNFNAELLLEHYTEITDVIVNIRPKIDISTQEAIKLATPIIDLIYNNLIPYCAKELNMAYFIKYRLDRYLPEEIVKYIK